MNGVRRKTSLLIAGALLVCGGIGVGAFASSLVTDAARFQRKPIRAVWPTTEPVGTDQAEAGRGWARTAFVGGLRQCPELNPAFLAGCRAEIDALSKRPAMMPGSYGGPLLVTTTEPPATPEPESEPTDIEGEAPIPAI